MDLLATVSAVLKSSGIHEISPVDFGCDVNLLVKWSQEHRIPGSLIGQPLLDTSNTSADAAVVANLPLLKEAYRMCKLAMAPYGTLGSVMYNLVREGAPSPSSPVPSVLVNEKEIISRIAGLSTAQLFHVSAAADVTKPRYCVFCVPPSEEPGAGSHLGQVVLSIRGTLTLSDVVTDVLASEETFAFGSFAHSGIATAARNIYEQARQTLLDALASHPGYELVVTGHSLGAGTALLLTILLFEECTQQLEDNTTSGAATYISPFQGVHVKCVAFAPPPVLRNTALLERRLDSPPALVAAPTLTSWVNRHDIVPRLSVSAVRGLVRLCHKIHRLHPSLPSRAVGAVDISDVLDSEDKWRAALSMKSTCSGEAELDDVLVDEQMIIPGRIYGLQQASTIVHRTVMQSVLHEAATNINTAWTEGLQKVSDGAGKLWSSIAGSTSLTTADVVEATTLRDCSTLAAAAEVTGAGAMPIGAVAAAAMTLVDPPPVGAPSGGRDASEGSQVPSDSFGLLPSSLLAQWKHLWHKDAPSPPSAATPGHHTIPTTPAHCRIVLSHVSAGELLTLPMHQAAVEDHLPDSYLSVLADVINAFDSVPASPLPIA